MPSQPRSSDSLSPDKARLKTQGLAFGQAFQTVFKVCAMYSVDHPAAERSMQQSWDLLTPLLKLGNQFTFGFMSQRLLLNSSLVSQTNLTHLEVEFAKREIAAVTFQSGMGLQDYKRALAVLTTRPAVIAERGGIKKFLAVNPIEGVRVAPASKPKEDGDMTEVGMDMESFLTAQAILGPERATGMSPLDLLLSAADPPFSPAYGASPQELVAVAEAATRNTITDPDGDVAGLLTTLTQMLSGFNLDVVFAPLPPARQADLKGHAPGVISAHLMEDAIAGWAAERLAASAGKGGSVSAGVVGDGWGREPGGSGADSGGTGGGMVEKEVLQALLRGLKATRVAERLMQKLAQFVEQANLPREVYERIHREVMWFTLPAEKKHEQLLSQNEGNITPQDFARLVQYVQEGMREGRVAEVADLAEKYFSTCQNLPADQRAAEMRRAPELLRALASIETLPLMHTLAEKLLGNITGQADAHAPCHLEATECLAAVAQNGGRFEDFEFVHKVAVELRRHIAGRGSAHTDCCGKALGGLLSVEATERLVESFLQKRSDAPWVRMAGSLLAMVGAPSAEAAFHRLEEEPAAANRLPLLRLIRSLGPAATEATCRRLADPRWYVVRNAAYVLGDLGDPELPSHLRPTLRHADLRVQQAALTSLLKSNASDRGTVLAEALGDLQAGVLEMALDELTVLKDPASVPYLERLVTGRKEIKSGVLERAVVALAAVPTESSAEALSRIASEPALPPPVRRAVLAGLHHHGSALAAELVAQLPNRPATPRPGDGKKAA